MTVVVAALILLTTSSGCGEGAVGRQVEGPAGRGAQNHQRDRPGGDGDMIKTLYVSSELVDCEGVGPQQCMQVRSAPDEPWELFYDQIDGFTFEPGFTYELRVRVTAVDNPPADASSLRYTLVDVVDKTPA
jgi:hypothetical protein